MKISPFIFYSEFGIFKKPDINFGENFLTYNFIHKPAILGILGSVMGFKGYGNDIEALEYHKKLFGVKIGIQPLKLINDAKPPYSIQNFEIKTTSSQKFFVQYLNHHGYGSREEEGNWIVKEQILLKPAYRVFLEQGNCDEDVFKKLIDKTERLDCDYYPYLGKNEFPLTIIPEKTIDNMKETEEKNIMVNSIIFKELCIKSESKIGKFFMLRENVPYKMEDYRYFFKEAMFSNLKLTIDYAKTKENGWLLVGNDERNLFLF